jgi:DNA-binding transcriptional ArsR family regulator
LTPILKLHNHTVVDTLSQAFAALCDPTRRAILHRLTQSAATVSELAEPFAISQQAISKHLAYLENAGLIAKKRCGREHVCTLEPRTIRQVADWAEAYRTFWEASYERLDVLLEQMKSQATAFPRNANLPIGGGRLLHPGANRNLHPAARGRLNSKFPSAKAKLHPKRKKKS